MGNSNLLHDIDQQDTEGNISSQLFMVILIVAVLGGIGAGYVLSKTKPHPNTTSTSASTEQTSKTAGIADKKTFKDKAEGVLKEGGIEGEGSFHLERPGGESQNVYLTSTTVDLSPYVGKKVRVWGATFNGQHAGWLMDVGLVETLQ